MAEGRLRFATDILRRLGEELNPSLDQGILELVKNSYDADAVSCTVELDLQSRDRRLTVEDDGNGLDMDAIEYGWLVLGRSSKTQTAPTPRFGRTPAGNKGLGRLAALRLGQTVKLVTVPLEDRLTRLEVNIDWREFEKASVVEDVPIAIRSTRLEAPAPHGTLIQIEGLHTEIHRPDVKRLARGILLLADPFGDSPTGFQPRLESKEFRDLAELVNQRYFRDAEYYLRAEIQQDGTGTAAVTDYRGQHLFDSNDGSLGKASGGAKYACPPATFELWEFKLDQKAFATRSTTIGEVREWLAEFGGVYLFLDGLRVAPYGDSGNDWLQMNLSRARSPEMRPSTNNSIGRVQVFGATDYLTQKTDRTGIIENEHFRELRRFATDALNWMARRRLAEREARRAHQRTEAPKGTSTAKKSLDQAVESLREEQKSSISNALRKYDRAREREVRVLKSELQLYRTLVTVGIASSVFAHESKQPIKLLQRSLPQIERRLIEDLPDRYEERFRKAIDRSKEQVTVLKAFGDLTLDFVSESKRRPSRVALHDVIHGIARTFTPLLIENQIRLVEKYGRGSPYLHATTAAIEAIVSNFLMNSVQAFKRTTPRDRVIQVETSVDDTEFHLIVSDNGPGILDIDASDIWTAGQSRTPGGTGLGLTIVRDTVSDMGGTVSAKPKGEMGGAEFEVVLPILGVES